MNKHPGIDAKKSLQIQNRRDPKVIQAEKERKKAAKEAKEKARQVEASQREVAQRNLEECRARQAASLEQEDGTYSQQGKSSTSYINSEFNTI